ncbi:hypothetical protein [Myxosarcina sp. GI1(2024)]
MTYLELLKAIETANAIYAKAYGKDHDDFVYIELDREQVIRAYRNSNPKLYMGYIAEIDEYGHLIIN